MSKSSTSATRREILIGGAAAVTVAGLPLAVAAGQPQPAGATASQKHARGETHMNRITTKDGTSIFYKDFYSRRVTTELDCYGIASVLKQPDGESGHRWSILTAFRCLLLS